MSVLDSASAVESPTPGGPRVDVLAFPAPTTTRFIVVLAATLAAALFVGDWLHGFLHGQQWVRDVGNCLRQNDYLSPVTGATEQLGRQQAASDCYAGVQHSRAAFAVGSTVVVMLIGICVLFIAPALIERRRGLQILSAKLAPVEQAVSELAARAGLRRRPQVMLGSAKQTDAFSYGSPRRYRIALPRAVVVRWRDRAMFDALVLHELSHIRNRDVSLSWLTRGVMYAVVPVLALPLLVGAATGVFSLFPDYIWRAAILAALVWVISAALLRSREHDADLRAAGLLGQTTTMVGLLGRARPHANQWWRRLRANHPAPDARTRVLVQPAVAAAVRFLDGLAPAVLAASALPLIDEIVTALATGNALAHHQDLVATVAGGLLLGCTVGVGIWRAVAVERVVSANAVAIWIPAFGVAVGLVLGQVASLANTTSGLRGGLDQPVWLVIPALAGLAATAVVYSLAEVWADLMSRLRSPLQAWLPGAVMASLIYAAALYLSHQLQMLLDKGSWAMTRRFLTTETDTWTVVFAVGAAAVMVTIAVTARRRGAMIPPWLLEAPNQARPVWATDDITIVRPLLIGVACGLPALVPYAVYRYSVIDDLDSDSIHTFLEVLTWCGAVSGLAATVILVVFVPRRGLALAMLAGPVAIGTFMLGFVVLNVRDGGANGIPFLAGKTGDIAGLWFLLTLIVAPLALLPRILRLGTLWSAVLAVVLSLSACAAAVNVTAHARPVTDADLVMPELMPALRDNMAAHEYLDGLAKQVLDGISGAYATFTGLGPEQMAADPAAAGERIRTEIVGPLTALQDSARSYQPPTDAVAEVHDSTLKLLDSSVGGFTNLADALASGDLDMLVQSMSALTASQHDFDDWMAGIERLRALTK